MPYLPKDRVAPATKVCRECGEEKFASEFTPARQQLGWLAKALAYLGRDQ